MIVHIKSNFRIIVKLENVLSLIIKIRIVIKIICCSLSRYRFFHYSTTLHSARIQYTQRHTVYAVIFEGRKFRGFRCKLVEREIVILEKKQWLNKETLYSTH